MISLTDSWANYDSGFTLIELLVVIAVIGILAAAAVPQIMDAICDSRTATAKSEISTIQTAIVQCQIEKSCDESSLENMEEYGLLTSQLENQYQFIAGGDKIKTSNVGCAWNGSSTGMIYDVEDGTFQSA